jgi:hypothetical protein
MKRGSRAGAIDDFRLTIVSCAEDAESPSGIKRLMHSTGQAKVGRKRKGQRGLRIEGLRAFGEPLTMSKVADSTAFRRTRVNRFND